MFPVQNLNVELCSCRIFFLLSMKSNLNKNFSASKTETQGTMCYFVGTPLEFNITMFGEITSRCRLNKTSFYCCLVIMGFRKVMLIEFGVELRPPCIVNAPCIAGSLRRAAWLKPYLQENGGSSTGSNLPGRHPNHPWLTFGARQRERSWTRSGTR